jgi:hypothetical protein
MPAAINLDRGIVRVVVAEVGPVCAILLLGHTLQNGTYSLPGYD